MLFAEIGPDFWMGVVAGAFGMFIIIMIGVNGIIKTTKSVVADDEKKKERDNYWWNDGKKPEFDDEN